MGSVENEVNDGTTIAWKRLRRQATAYTTAVLMVAVLLLNTAIIYTAAIYIGLPSFMQTTAV